MQTVIVLVHLMIVLAMVGLVLLQKSEGGGLGMGGGGGFLSSRGTSNVLTRATAILAAVFFATSLILSILAGVERKPRSILEGGGAPSVPSAPGAPLGGSGGGGILDQLRGGTQQQPVAPAAPPSPSGPQVPRSQ